MIRIFGFTAFLFGCAMVLATYKDLLPFWAQDKDKMIYVLWKQDLEKLSMYKKIPRAFADVQFIEYIPLSEGTKQLLSRIKAPINTKPNGKYSLQIKLDDYKDEDGYGLFIQYHLIEIKSGNTIWEMARNLSLKTETVSQNKSKSDPPPPASSPSGSQEQPAPRSKNPSEQQP